jgi:hypothetical protein
LGGEALGGARVELLDADAGAGPDIAALFGGGTSAQTDGQGRFSLENVKVGRYRVRVSHALRAMTWDGETRVESGENRCDVDLPIAILEGRVTGPDKKPIAGARVQAERATSEGGSQHTERRVISVMANDSDEPEVSFGTNAGAIPSVLTDADGRYRLRGVLPDVDLVVKAQASDVQPGRSATVRVAANQTKSDVDVELQTGGTIDVTLVRQNGNPASSCMVEATFDGEGQADPRHEFSGSKGSVKLGGLKPGRWRVHVESFGGLGSNRDERSKIPDQTIEVVAGRSAPARFEIP